MKNTENSRLYLLKIGSCSDVPKVSVETTLWSSCRDRNRSIPHGIRAFYHGAVDGPLHVQKFVETIVALVLKTYVRFFKAVLSEEDVEDMQQTY
ncbi:hypothetical protein RB195_009389 [Necator americanus]|uniref:Uncharacterized protein n=1 Tax=Necator americanus TaxID=51031 RepID=A0ABR1CV01_NECAM